MVTVPIYYYVEPLYMHIRRIYIFSKISLNGKLAMVTVPFYYSVKALYMHIEYIYIFSKKSEQEIENGNCPYQLLCGATFYAYHMHIYFLKQV